jgi:hypothetical protein
LAETLSETGWSSTDVSALLSEGRYHSFGKPLARNRLRQNKGSGYLLVDALQRGFVGVTSDEHHFRPAYLAEPAGSLDALSAPF